jgi:hypothetical protein
MCKLGLQHDGRGNICLYEYKIFISVILQGFLGWNPKYKGGKGGKLSM